MPPLGRDPAAVPGLLRSLNERAVPHAPGTRSYGAVFFEPVPEVALVLGLDLGARFIRGALCDLRGEVRARQDVEIAGADAAQAIEVIAGLRDSLAGSAGLPGGRIDGVVVGVPGSVDATGRVHLATVIRGLEDMAFGAVLQRRLGLAVTIENDVNLAALGERWTGVARGVDDFVFLSVGTGLGAGLVLRGELHRGAHGAAGEVDLMLAGSERDLDPSAGAVTKVAERVLRASGRETVLAPPYDPPAIFAAARGGDTVALEVVDQVALRIALHIVPIAAVVDVALVVLGGGLGINGDLLLDPVRRTLARWLPYPPRVEISGLGEASVLWGALSVGLRDALENVFAERGGATQP